MGFLSRLFAKSPDYPPLPDGSRAASKVAEVEHELEELVHKTRDPLEVVPSEHAAYVFLGRPPKKFGLAWIHDGKVSGLNTLIEEHGLSAADVEKVIDQLRDAYQRHQSEAHYCARIEDRAVVVTPSPGLEQAVHGIIDRITH